MFFIRDTACHQRRLGSMEAADSSTGDGNEHHRENRILLVLGTEPVPHLRQIRALHVKHHQDTDRHKIKAKANNG